MGMDKIIKKKKWPLKRVALYALVGLAVVLVLIMLITSREASLNIKKERIYVEKAKDLRERTKCQISASGRYLTESYFLQDIWLHDLETGEVKLLVSPEEGYIVLNHPGIPGQWNSMY